MLESDHFSGVYAHARAPPAALVNDSAQDAFPTLVIAGGPRNGESLVLDSPGLEKVLGSAPDCHLRFTGSSIDYHHAGVFWDDAAGILISDQASATGTWVNGERVQAPRVLQDGDRISLGPPGSADSVKLLVQIPPQLEAPLVLDTEDDPSLLGAGPRLDLPGPDEEDDVFDATEPPPPPTVPAPPVPAPPMGAGPTVPAARPAAPAQPPAVVFDGETDASTPRRPVFTDQLPSIVPEHPREAPVFQPMAIPPLDKPRSARVSRGRMLPLLVGGVAMAGAGVAAYFAVRAMSRPVPALASVLPARAEAGQSVTLSGSGFAAAADGNVVHFGQQRGTVTAASNTQLTVVVPAALEGAAEVPLTVETKGGRSNVLRLPLRVVPRLSGLEPDVVLPGAEIVIRGQKLDGKNPAVTIGGMRATVKEATPTALRVEVPRIDSMLEGQAVSVSVQAGGETARPLTLTLGHLPLLTQMEPQRGEAGEKVVIKGRGFDPDPVANVVTFSGEPAVVLTASEQQLEVIAPAVPAPGNLFKAPVVVRARGAASSGPFEFALLRPSSGVFVPRFYPGAVAQDPRRVFVSSEAGPLFLLSSADGNASTAERAQKVSAALNAFFAPGAAVPTIELRSGDPPAVAAAGAAQPVVRATAEDAAGYAQPWNATMKGQRVSAAALAAHWAALVHDYVTLFVQKQRPTRVVEVSPRGKVLLELHAEGERLLGSGGGVPANLLTPPGPVLGPALRELALTVPPRGQSVPGAALVGRWTGTMEDVDGGARRIQLDLRLEGTQLAGSISTRAGQLSMDVPLTGVRYEKGTLNFDVPGGPLRRFRGSASGSTLSGQIFDQAQKQTGTFTLQYVQ